jgi:hypothetical protein
MFEGVTVVPQLNFTEAGESDLSGFEDAPLGYQSPNN